MNSGISGFGEIILSPLCGFSASHVTALSIETENCRFPTAEAVRNDITS
jgi:hypothetical protein